MSMALDTGTLSGAAQDNLAKRRLRRTS